MTKKRQILPSGAACDFLRFPGIQRLAATRLVAPEREVSDSTMNSIDELRAVQIARAFGDHTRFLIYKHIAELKEMRCQDICLGTSVRASTVSHHLKVLSGSGLIESRREGQGVYYRAVSNVLRAYVNYLRTLERKRQAL